MPDSIPSHKALLSAVALGCSASVCTAAQPAQVVSKNETGVCIATEAGDLFLRPLAENAIRVRLAKENTPESPGYVLSEIINYPPFDLIESDQTIRVIASGIEASLDRATGALTFLDSDGRTLLTESSDGRSIEPATIQGEPTFAIEQTFLSPSDERLFGTGQFQDGYLNIRGLSRRLTQVNTQIAIPFLLSSKGYGLLWLNDGLTELNPGDRQVEFAPEGTGDVGVEVDVTTTEGTKKETRRSGRFAGSFTVDQPGRYAFLLDVGQKMASRYKVEIDGKTVVDMDNLWLPPTTSWISDLPAGEHTVALQAGAEDHPTLTFRRIDDTTTLRSPVADALDYVIFAGDADTVISSYRKLTGAAPLPPLWALGYIHCRERFKSQEELLTTAAEFRKRGLPMDLIVQDWQYWGRHGWNAMRFDETDYPDPASMVRELHAMNARLMVSVWSKIDASSEVGKEFTARGYYIPDTTWVDFFNPGAAAFYWENCSERLLSLGIDAWWQDATEPENDDLVGRRTHLGPGEKTRNLYPLLVNKTVYEGQRADAPDRRVFILTRSAFSGQQRYGAATWSGDIGNDWDTFRRQIPAGLNFVITGQPYWTTDCGGFFRPNGQYTDPDFHERFLRWFQYSTFSPLQRVHGYQSDTEFWRYGDTVEREARRYLEFRQRLLPYIYSAAARVTFDGSTLMRPLVMDFTSDPRALDREGEFMFGPAFHVAPVVRPNVETWDVYLPHTPGGWFDFWTGEHLPGGSDVRSPAPLERIPLHVRAGSIVPLGPATSYTGEKTADPIELRIYRGADGAFTLYEDEGVNYNYENGARAEIPIRWDDKAGCLTIGDRCGSFPGMVQERVFHVVWVRPGRGVGSEVTATADAELRYTGKEISISPPQWQCPSSAMPRISNLGKQGISAPASSEKTWSANWISPADTADSPADPVQNLWACYRRSFSLTEKPSSAPARIAVDSKYWLWVNGHLAVFEGGLKRGPNPNDTYYDELDLAPWLHEGENQIAVLTWYWGRDGYSHKSSGRAGFLFELHVGPAPLLSDASWKAIRHPAFGETDAPLPNYRLPEFNVRYDARLAPDDWLAAGFDDSAWPAARELGVPPDAPWNTLVPRPSPLWRDSGLLPYENAEPFPRITDGSPILATLPRNLTITPYLKIKAPAGLLIDIRTDNYKGGSEYNIRTEYLTRGGEQEFESPAYFNGHSVHYSFPPGVEILDLRYRETRYDTDFTGHFECDDPFLNRLWLKCRNTMNVNMRDSIQDPDRERAQWWGDAAILLGKMFYSCDTRSHALIRKAILELVHWRKPDGVLFSPVPAGSWDQELPGQMLSSIGEHGLWYYYRYTGDAATIATAYPAVRDYLALWQLGSDGLLIHRPGGWDWGDWGENIDRPVMDNALLYQALGAAIEMARLTGHEDDIPDYEAKRASIAANYNRVFWQGTEYRSPGYAGVTDDRGHGLAALYGLAGPDQWPALKKVFTTSFEASPYMEKYLLESLFRMGDTDAALARLKTRYRKMVESELTTLWEGWGIGAEGCGGGSYNHGWAGGPLTLLGEYVAGIAPSSPGFATYQVKPQLGSLRRVRAGIDTLKGRITVAFERTDHEFRLHLESPPATLATVVLPLASTIECNGYIVWNASSTDPPLPGLASANSDSTHVRFTVAPGFWEFTTR